MSVKAANNFISQGPEFARAMVGVLGAVVLAWAIAAVLLRRGLSGPVDISLSPATPDPTQPNPTREP